MAFFIGGCSTTVVESRVGQVAISTRPPGATIELIDDNGTNVVGVAPVVVKHKYQVPVRRFRSWHWIWPALTGGCSAVGFSQTDNVGGVVVGAMCALAFVPTFIVNLVHQVRSGAELKTAPSKVHVQAHLDGYHAASRAISFPEEKRVELRLWPESLRAGRALTGAPKPAPKAPPRPIVAVFSVEDGSGKLDATLLVNLTDFLAAKLTEVTGYRVVPQDKLRQELRQQKKESYKQCFDQACQIELGRAVAAQKSLATKLLQVGDYCAIIATLYDLRTEATDGAASVRTSCGTSDLMKAMEQVAKKLGARSR